MKKKILFVMISLFLIHTTSVNAASLNVTASQTSVTKGGSVTVTVKANDLTGKFSITSSNSNVLSGGTSSVWLENETKTYKFSAKNTGTVTIKVTPVDVSDSSGNFYSTSKTITVKVVAPREKSTNNNLTNLKVEGYTLSPSFNKNTTSYTVDLPSEVEKIMLSATKESSYAKVSGTGEVKVEEGENKIEIVVESETGSKKTYTIIATVKDSNPITVTVNNEEYTVIKRKSALTTPDGFEETTTTISEKEVPAYEKEGFPYLLIGLKSKDGKIKLFKYDQEKETYEEYKSMTIESYTFYEKTPEDVPSDLEKVEETINEEKYQAYKSKKDGSIYLYGSLLTGDLTGWYRYSLEDDTLQYEEIKEEEKKEVPIENNEPDTKDVIIIALSTLSAILFVSLIAATVSKRRKRRKRKRAKKEFDLD